VIRSKALCSWRILLLAWAVMLAPQISTLHALSHGLSGNGGDGSSEVDKAGHAAKKVCDSCLALAQLGAALPASFEWLAPSSALPTVAAVVPVAAESRPPRVAHARGPPLLAS
jgi:hypothetical protein